MALLNEILVGRFNRALQKLLGMKGEAPVPQLASELMPVLVWQLTTEERYLQGWDRFNHSLQRSAAVGATAGVRLRNPGTSNTIVVLEHVRLRSALGDTASLELNGTDADLGAIAVVTATRLDGRGRSNPTLVWSSGDNPTDFTVAGAAHERISLAAAVDDVNFIRTVNAEVPLLPGFSFQARGVTTGDNLRLSVRWRERFLEESERT